MMKFLLPIEIIKTLLPILAIIAGVFVISTKNPIISVFNLIVLYILVAFYLIFIGLTYLGISYIVVYIGAIAILFLFVIMMIDVEVIEKRTNNYLPLLFLLLGVFFFILKNNLYNLGFIKMKSLFFKEKYTYIGENNNYERLFNIRNNLEKKAEFGIDINMIRLTNDFINKEKVDYNNISIYNINHNNYNRENIEILNTDIISVKFFDDKYINTNLNYDLNVNNLLIDNIKDNNYLLSNILDLNIWNNYSNLSPIIEDKTNSYLLIITNWDSAVNKITQISSIGDVLYTMYHSYIYILSVILLLGLIGAIILTVDSYQELKTTNINKMNSFLLLPYLLTKFLKILYIQKLMFFIKYYLLIFNISILFNNIKYILLNNWKTISIYIKNFKITVRKNESINNKLIMPAFFDIINTNSWHSEFIMGNLIYFVITSVVIAILLLFINSFFSLNIKYLEKEGGFECGFTSFLQTRERFNVIFYRVSLLFLVFDLEIILIYPYPAIFQKNQNISKNNVLAFIYILIIGFIYELKEGALNIVKKGRSTELNNYK